MTQSKQLLALLFGSLLLAACGGGSKDLSGGGDSDNGGSDDDNTVTSYTLAVELKACSDITDLSTCSAAADNILPADKPNLIASKLVDNKGNAISGAVIEAATKTYTDGTVGTIEPVTRKTTDSKGEATFLLVADDESQSKTGEVTLTATIPGVTSTTTTSSAFTFGQLDLTLELTASPTDLPLKSTANVDLKVYSNGALYTAPVSITLASSCATSNKATLTSSVTTSNGVASATYQGSGTSGTCGVADEVRASMGDIIKSVTINNLTAPSSSILANDPTSQVIFTPASGFTDNTNITFKVTDAYGNPKSNESITFDFAGIENQSSEFEQYALTPAINTTDANGQAVVNVKAGAIPVPFRVIAYLTNKPEIRATSKPISVSMGFPDNDSFTFAAKRYNIEGAGFADETDTITMQLSDRFNNPVPDGTVVSFTTEGGSIKGDQDSDQGTTGSCITKNGVCNAILTTTNPKPDDGRVTVLAYVQGEESFFDVNGNKVFDQGDLIGVGNSQNASEVPGFMANAGIKDVGEPYLDTNVDDGDAFIANTDQFIDINNDGIRNAGDGSYTGQLCSQDLMTRGFCTRGFVNLFQKKLEFIFTGLNRQPVQVWDSATKTWSSAITELDVSSKPAYLRFMPSHLAADGVTINPAPEGSTMAATTDNGGKIRAACPDGNTTWSYDSPYPTATRPFWICLRVDPETTPNTTHTGVLEIKTTTPRKLTLASMITVKD